MRGGVVGNLLEKYWFLDSFGADLGWGESGERGFEGIYNLFNNFGRRCGIIEMWEAGR